MKVFQFSSLPAVLLSGGFVRPVQKSHSLGAMFLLSLLVRDVLSPVCYGKTMGMLQVGAGAGSEYTQANPPVHKAVLKETVRMLWELSPQGSCFKTS